MQDATQAALDLALSTFSKELPARARIQPLVDELTARGASRVRHTRRTFLHHLVGTWRVLVLWNQSEALCRAGLFHSVYGTQYFHQNPYDAGNERSRVRELIGEESESIAFLFCTLDRRHIIELAQGPTAVHDGADALEVRRRDAAGSAQISTERFCQLLALEAANLAEQISAPRGSPGLWLTRVAPLIRLARMRLAFPAIVTEASQAITPEEESRACATYEAVVAASGVEDAESAARQSCEHNSWVGESQLALASAAFERGEARAATEATELAIDRLVSWGTPWDKRLSLARWLSLALKLHADACEELGLADASSRYRLLAGSFESEQAAP